MKIRFKPPAVREVERAFAWYEEKRVGLDVRFREELDNSLAIIAADPESGPLLRPRI